MQQEQEKRRQYTQKKQKERREIATAMAQGNVNRNERRFTAGEMSDEERSVWNFKLKLDTLSKAKLVDLCKAKSITGSHAKTKPELAWILMKIKHHGGPGRCPTCLQRSGSRSQTANGLAFFPRGYPARRHSRYTCGCGVHFWRHSVPAQVHVQSFCPAACSKLEGRAGRERYSEGFGVKARSSALRCFWTDSLQS